MLLVFQIAFGIIMAFVILINPIIGTTVLLMAFTVWAFFRGVDKFINWLWPIE